MEFLSLVISRCPPERINRQSSTSSAVLKGYKPNKLASAKVLVKFMSEKLDDTDTIIPALKGLASLVTLPAFTSVEAVDVMKAYGYSRIFIVKIVTKSFHSLFAHVKMKTLAQSQRFTVYTIIDSLVAKHREGNSAEYALRIFLSNLLFQL